MSKPSMFLPDYISDRDDDIITLPPNEQVPEAVYYAPYDVAATNPTHALCKVAELHRYTRGAGQTIAILDTGIDVSHSAYRDRIAAVRDQTGSHGQGADGHGHGTHCAGIALAGGTGPCPMGVAPEARLISIKVLTDAGSGLTSWIAAGVRQAADLGATVISMSLGGGGANQGMIDAIKYAVGKGCTVVAAAGNSGPGRDTIDYPGGYPSVWCCGAVDNAGRVASFSSRGDALDYCTPGVSVLSAFLGDRVATMSGTSMATPYLAGLIALLRSLDKDREVLTGDASEDTARIAAHAIDIPPALWDTVSGWGIPVWDRLFKELADQPPPPPVDPPTNPGDLTLSLSALMKEGRKRVVMLLAA